MQSNYNTRKVKINIMRSESDSEKKTIEEIRKHKNELSSKIVERLREGRSKISRISKEGFEPLTFCFEENKTNLRFVHSEGKHIKTQSNADFDVIPQFIGKMSKNNRGTLTLPFDLPINSPRSVQDWRVAVYEGNRKTQEFKALDKVITLQIDNSSGRDQICVSFRVDKNRTQLYVYRLEMECKERKFIFGIFCVSLRQGTVNLSNFDLKFLSPTSNQNLQETKKEEVQEQKNSPDANVKEFLDIESNDQVGKVQYNEDDIDTEHEDEFETILNNQNRIYPLIHSDLFLPLQTEKEINLKTQKKNIHSVVSDETQIEKRIKK